MIVVSCGFLKVWQIFGIIRIKHFLNLDHGSDEGVKGIPLIGNCHLCIEGYLKLHLHGLLNRT